MMKTCTTTRWIATGAAVLAAAIAASGLSGCRGQRTNKPPRQFIPDMDDSPKHRNQSQTAFFADGRVLRPRVANTVAFGSDSDPASAARANYLKEDPLVFLGFDPSKPKTAEGDPAFEAVIPGAALDHWITEANARGSSFDPKDPGLRTAAMTAMVRRGQERFNIYCSACHGYEGEGADVNALSGGLVGRRWSYNVPSFHDPKYSDRSLKTGKDGYLFHTIRNGVPEADPTKPPKMPAYADKVSVSDSWAIVAYLRTLQTARTAAPATRAAAESASPTQRIASENRQ